MANNVRCGDLLPLNRMTVMIVVQADHWIGCLTSLLVEGPALSHQAALCLLAKIPPHRSDALSNKLLCLPSLTRGFAQTLVNYKQRALLSSVGIRKVEVNQCQGQPRDELTTWDSPSVSIRGGGSLVDDVCCNGCRVGTQCYAAYQY